MYTPAKGSRNQPRIGLALSGGSVWGMAHVGVLKALSEAGVEIDYVAGTSAGSLAAAFFAFGIPIERILTLSKNLNWKSLSRFTLSRFGFSTNKLMGDYILRELGDVRIEDAHIPLAIVATDIETGARKVFREGLVADAVRASTSIPGVFTPVEIDGTFYVDGGIAERLPILTLKEMGADITIGVHLSSRLAKFRPKDIRDVLMRSIGILARARDAYVLGLADVLIEPDISGLTGSDFTDAELLLTAGYGAAKDALPKIDAAIRSRQSVLHRTIRNIRSWFRRKDL